MHTIYITAKIDIHENALNSCKRFLFLHLALYIFL